MADISTQPPTVRAIVVAIDRALNELDGMPEFDYPTTVLEDIIQAEIALRRARKAQRQL
jgi:hypothetical protein